MTGWRTAGKGKLEDTPEGLLLTSDPEEKVLAISETSADDFIYEADVMIKDRQPDAALLFRSSEEGQRSYMLQIVPDAGLIRLKDGSSEKGKLHEERKVSWYKVKSTILK